ncbi:hypothetical protein TorRG33x02_004440 [Trema orientale]|uniref:Uncharacterized protein n=1 Tax=Trema orientale TaxID=63057 RepID=A0A2P5G269_TREOI|nr:hypothetical protein TorRG33x02_004440 [Trema orientale]
MGQALISPVDQEYIGLSFDLTFGGLSCLSSLAPATTASSSTSIGLRIDLIITYCYKLASSGLPPPPRRPLILGNLNFQFDVDINGLDFYDFVMIDY